MRCTLPFTSLVLARVLVRPLHPVLAILAIIIIIIIIARSLSPCLPSPHVIRKQQEKILSIKNIHVIFIIY